MNRRAFVAAVAVGAVGVCRGVDAEEAAATAPSAGEPSPSKLPRWRGFNLLEKFNDRHSGAFHEADFELLSEWGFNLVRLPMSYRCWTDPSDWLKLREGPLKEVDQAVEFGRRHGIHVNLNLHRAPGYCVNPPEEPADLWKEDSALEACAFHWAHLARRYKGVPSSRVSFDLLNEPKDLEEPVYARVVRRLVQAIRAEDPGRLIIADGLKWGTAPVAALADLGIAQSTRGYSPSQVSHYRASWVEGADQWAQPTWPITVVRKEEDGTEKREFWDKDRLRRERIEPWRQLQAKGVGVHVGEWGCHNRTPHDVALAWMKDQLDLWNEAGWGWALWNLRGSFGVLDSDRADVTYDMFRGRRLDRAMLELLRAS